jgi:hypothetical protein
VAALLLLPLWLLCSACQALPAPLQQPRAPATPTPSPVKAVSLIAGPPIVVLGTTAHLPGSLSGRALFPVGSYKGSIIVSATSIADRSAPALYDLWDPATGSLTAIAGWESEPGSNERLLGTSTDWVLIARDGGQPAAGSTLLIRNLATGEVRQVANTEQGGPRPRAAIGDGWVAWLASAPGREALHAYAISTGAESVVPARSPTFAGVALANGQLAWAQSGGNQGPRIVLHELPSGAFQAIPTGSVSSLVLANDGRSVVWLETGSASNPGLFARNLGSDETDRLVGGQGIGYGLSVSGPYVAWQPRPGGGPATAGYYNLQTHELRLIQKPATSPAFAAVMGNWFVWSVSARPSQFGASAGIVPTPPDICCYAVRLAP